MLEVGAAPLRQLGLSLRDIDLMIVQRVQRRCGWRGYPCGVRSRLRMSDLGPDHLTHLIQHGPHPLAERFASKSLFGPTLAKSLTILLMFCVAAVKSTCSRTKSAPRNFMRRSPIHSLASPKSSSTLFLILCEIRYPRVFVNLRATSMEDSYMW